MPKRKTPVNFECVDTGESIKPEITIMDRRIEMRMTINRLRDESQALRQEVSGLKEQVDQMEQQNTTILKLIGEQQACLTGIFKVETQASCEYMHRFPIQTQEALDSIENEINDNTRESMINTVRSLLTPGGIVKRLGNVLSTEICLEYNLDGIISKKRLKNYSNLLNVMFKATMKDGWTQKLFLLEMRHGLKLVKHKHFKSICLMRKAARAALEDADSEDDMPSPKQRTVVGKRKAS